MEYLIRSVGTALFFIVGVSYGLYVMYVGLYLGEEVSLIVKLDEAAVWADTNKIKLLDILGYMIVIFSFAFFMLKKVSIGKNPWSKVLWSIIFALGALSILWLWI